MIQWIKVTSKLPSKGIDVLLFSPEGIGKDKRNIIAGHINKYCNKFVWNRGSSEEIEKQLKGVTHWCLPDKPNE